MKVIRWEFRRGKAAVLIPDWGRGEVRVDDIRRNPERVRKAVGFAIRGDYRSAMIENSIYYCERIGYPVEVIERVREFGCCVGLSGNGPAFVAFGDSDSVRDVSSVWSEYGRVIVTELAREPVEDVVISPDLFENVFIQWD